MRPRVAPRTDDAPPVSLSPPPLGLWVVLVLTLLSQFRRRPSIAGAHQKETLGLARSQDLYFYRSIPLLLLLDPTPSQRSAPLLPLLAGG